ESSHLSLPTVAGSNEGALERNSGAASSAVLSHGSYNYDQSEERDVHLRDYWRVILKHIWLVIGPAILVPTLVTIYLIRSPDIYEAQARIQVDLENANPLLGGMSKNSSVILNNETNDPAYFNTQLQILTGPGLLRRIVKNLDLEHNPDFASDQSSNSKSTWSRLRSLLGFKQNTESKSIADELPV